VQKIYAAGIATGNATFETEPPGRDQFVQTLIRDLALVGIDEQGDVVGWIVAHPVSDRCVYSGVVEHSVYVDPAHQGKGVGTSLLAALIDRSEAEGIWTIQSGVFPENTASLELHTRSGFEVVGTRKAIGKHQGRWRDVLLLERRSGVIGQS
jgi:phosphinothricin acetyltransferase